MKRTFLCDISILIAAIALFFSCGGGNNKTSLDKAENIEFDSIIVDTIVPLTASPQSPESELHLRILYAKDNKLKAVNDTIIKSDILSAGFLPQADRIKTVDEAVKAFVSNYIKSYKEDFGMLYAQDKEAGASFNTQYSCKTYVRNEKPGIINYITEIYNYSGGAHGANATIAKNIDVKSGKIIRLSDIFVPGYEKGLTDIIVSGLCDMFDVKNFGELQEKAIFMNMDAYVTDNFIMTDDGIEFIYVDNEIAPHAVGEIRVMIENGDMKNLLK